MRCVRCGFCCYHYVVGILVDPKKGITEKNIVAKESNTRCLHLRGDEPGKFSCKLHGLKIYKQTPCYEYGQIERSKSCVCRLGEYVMSKSKDKRMALVKLDA
jgi:hypothetical protein